MTMEYIILEYRLSSEIDFFQFNVFFLPCQEKAARRLPGKGWAERTALHYNSPGGGPSAKSVWGAGSYAGRDALHHRGNGRGICRNPGKKGAPRRQALSFSESLPVLRGQKPGSPCFLRRSQVKFRCQHEISSRFRRKLLTKSLFCCQSPGGGSARSRRAGEV